MMNYAALLALAIAAPIATHAQDYTVDKPAESARSSAVPLTPEQQAALEAIDIRVGAVEALAAKIDDPAYKGAVLSAVKDFRKRRAALAKSFDQGLYEALMHSVISRYQIVALWLKPPALPNRRNSLSTESRQPSEAVKSESAGKTTSQ